MGKYFTGNVQDLLDIGAHVIMEPPTTLEKLPDGKALICMIETILKVTITLCDSNERMHECMNMLETMLKLWLLVDKQVADEYFE